MLPVPVGVGKNIKNVVETGKSKAPLLTSLEYFNGLKK